jgi:hypothetical protein
MENTNTMINATIIPAYNLFVSRLILFLAFLLSGVNVDAGGEGTGTGGGV